MPMTENIEQGRTFTRRLILLMGAQGLALGGLVARMYQLQVSESDALAQNAHFNAGNAAFNGEDWQAAVDDYTAALLRNPDDQDVVADQAGAQHGLDLGFRLVIATRNEWKPLDGRTGRERGGRRCNQRDSEQHHATPRIS